MTYQTIVTAAAPTAKLFLDAGFPTNRNLALIDGEPLLLRAIESSAHPSEATIVVINRDEEESSQPCTPILRYHAHVSSVIKSPSSVKGALASALLGLGEIDLDRPLLLAPGDAILNVPFWKLLESSPHDASALTVAFTSSNPRWSYLKENERGEIIQVAEKRTVGRLATTGHFFFRRAGDFLDASTWVLTNNAMVQDRFFVSTALNYLISIGKAVSAIEISRTQYESYSKPHDFIIQES
jgi:hypothetical protein